MALAGGAGALTVTEVMERAVANRPEVGAAKAALGKAVLDEPGVLANLDPAFVASGMRNVDESPQAVPQIFGIRTVRDDFKAGLRQRTLIGTEMELTLGANRQKTFFDQPMTGFVFIPSDPVVTSSLSLSVNQSLLKNLWGRPDRARRGMARAGVRAAKARLDRTRDLIAMEAGAAFLDFIYAREELALREQAVEDAQRFLDTVDEKRRFGLSEESDQAQASVNLALRRLELTSAKSQLAQARLRLLAAMGTAPSSGARESLDATWDFAADMPVAKDVGIEDALAARPDLEAAKAFLAGAESRARFQKLMGLPTLMAFGSYGFAGLDSSYGSALSDAFGRGHPVYNVGLSLALPIKGAAARVADETAERDLDTARQEKDRIELIARQEILASRENAELARQRARTAESLVKLQSEKLSAERRNFKRGRSSTEILIRFAEEERAGRRELLRARTGLAKAVYALKLATGERLGR